MTGTLTPAMLALIAFCVLTETAREVCFKHSADNEKIGRAHV